MKNINPSIASDEPANDGQIETTVALVTDATRKAAGASIRELVRRGVLTKDSIERVRRNGDKVVAAVTETAKRVFAELAENVMGLVKLISGAETITLEPTEGKATIAEAKHVFTAGIDPDFKSWGTNVPGSATGPTEVTVHEMIKDGTFAQVFGGMNNNLDALCLTQAQIIQFVQNHRKWLRTDGWATFFLFKVGSEFFVARVRLYSGGCLRVYVYRFSYDVVWVAEYRLRVVVPQLEPVAPSVS